LKSKINLSSVIAELEDRKSPERLHVTEGMLLFHYSRNMIGLGHACKEPTTEREKLFTTQRKTIIKFF